MRPPYAMLHWISLLLFRIGEYILLEPILRSIKRLKMWWNTLLPPRTKG
ncbi:hypothetical protein DSOL_4202 [Desulfosporosinus metallidurans]|uniref:Uncharacterized protein n=2 Tax=Desulfosporosinus metallidurans TaxID=1888891 RepID=A0A1Q8QLF8_9FIRM|nr:hypothetical protein DSOL_4202 [Desulfosporosinus metallidurans]